MLLEIKGNRVLQRTSTGSTITDIITFDGYTETSISGGSTTTINYYGANGQRVALKLNGTLSYLLSDTLGSSTIALTSDGSGQALQLYSPYGSVRYSWGSMPTTYNFTGQRLDSQTGLLYYNFRYYDPVSERFVRADTVESNAGGMDPYAYVGDNPETRSDPTGHIVLGEDGSFGHIDLSGYLTSDTNAYAGWLWDDNTPAEVYKPIYNPNTDTQHSPLAKISRALGWSQFQQTWNDPHASWMDKATAFGNMVSKNVNNLLILSMLLSGPEGDAAEVGGSAVETALGDLGGVCGGGLSFSAATHVATAHGEQAIGTLHVGDKVWAYNPQTQKMELQPILHVWINHDHDLVDLTLTIISKGSHGHTTTTREVLHTNERHPFLTVENGFVPVSHLRLGMHILRANGGVGVVTTEQVVPGVQTMYNLEVALDHTYTVSKGQYIVHNSSCTDPNLLFRVLRPDEDTTAGIFPKDPNADESVFRHIRLGSKSWFQSQFVSTTSDFSVAAKWAGQNGRIAVIDASQITGDIIDVSNRDVLARQGITYPSLAYSWAISSREVLIDGIIPPEAILWVLSPPW